MDKVLPAHVVERLREAGTRATEKGAEISGSLKELYSSGGGSLSHLAKKGRVNVLARMGRMEISHDKTLERRQGSVAQTRRVLQDIDREFALLVKYVGLMAEHYENLSGLLDRFRSTCDNEITAAGSDGDDHDSDEGKYHDDAADDDDDLPAAAATAPVGDEGRVSDNPNSLSAPRAAAGGAASPSDGPRDGRRRRSPGRTYRAAIIPAADGGPSSESDSFVNILSGASTALFSEGGPSEITEFCAKMKSLTAELQETIQSSCMNISRSTMHQLESEAARVAREVEDQQLDHDLLKDEARQLTEHVSKVRDSLEANNRAPVAQIDPGHRATVLEELRRHETALAVKQERLRASRTRLRQRCRDARGELRFLLEQTSMSTWSCYNVFFQSLSNFFEETTIAGRKVCQELIKLKNSQGISRRLTEERRTRLEQQRASAQQAQRHRHRDCASFVEAGGGGGGGDLPHGRDDKDDDFDEFVTSRITGSAAKPSAAREATAADGQASRGSGAAAQGSHSPSPTPSVSPARPPSSSSAPAPSRDVLDDLFS